MICIRHNRVRNLFIRPMTGCALLLAGCMSGRGTWKIPAIDDPPSLSPRHRSLYRPSPPTPTRPEITAPSPGNTHRDLKPADNGRKLSSAVPAKSPETDGADRSPRRRNTLPGGPSVPRDGTGGPAIVPQGVTVPAQLELVVHAPPKRQVGSLATFRLTIRNVGDKPADAVVVRCRFPDGLAYPGSAEREVTRTLGRLPAGKSRAVSLTLRGEKAGSRCCEFEVTSRGAERAWKSVCVEFVPRSLGVAILGPRQRTLGSRAEFTIKLTNTTSRVLKNVRATLRQDAALVPKEASKGAAWDKKTLRWNLQSVAPGAEVQLQIEFDCHKTAADACFSLAVTADGFPGEDVEQCLRIDKPPGVVRMQVRDRDDLLRVGEETEYVVTVHNTGWQSVRGIRVTAEIPGMFRIISADVRQAKHRLMNHADITGRTVTFAPVATLGGGGTLEYRIRVKAFGSGDGTFRVRLSHAIKKNVITVAETTTVNPSETAATTRPRLDPQLPRPARSSPSP